MRKRSLKTSSKVHFKGVPCKCHKRWKSCILTSTTKPAKVTCKRCLNKLAAG